MPLKYEPKRHLRITDYSGDYTEFILRGNLTVGEVLGMLNYSPERFRLTMEGEALNPNTLLKEVTGIEESVLKVQKRR